MSMKIRGLTFSMMLLAGAMASPTGALAEDPKQGGKVVYAQSADIFRFDPFDLAIGNFAMLNTVYDPLIRVSAADATPQPWLVKEWSFNDKGTELTLKLQENVKFHSGRAMTAEDVKWTIEQYQNPENAAIIQQAVKLITDMDVVDPHTLVLKFDSPFATAFDMLELIFVIDRDGEEQLRNTPAGTGPFKLASWDPGLEARYVRNDDYWREGQPFLDEFVQRAFPDPQAMVSAYESGSVDIVMYPTTQDYNRLKDSPDHVALAAAGCCEVNVNFNTANKPWDSKLVRQALNHAIDRARFVNIAFQGDSTTICQPIRSGWAHNSGISVDDECKFDLELAKSLLAEAGYKDGFKMEALVSSTAMPESPVLAQIMKDDLAKIGIEIEILDLEQTAYNNMGDKSLYKDMYIQIVGRTNKDPGSLYALTVAFRPETNVAQFRDEEYENLIRQGLQTVDPEERKEIYQRIAEIVTDESFSLVVAPRTEFFLLTPQIEGFQLNRDGMLLASELWLSE